MDTSTISFCGTTLFKHEDLTQLDTEHDSEALDSDSKKLRDFIGWDNDSETLQRPHTSTVSQGAHLSYTVGKAENNSEASSFGLSPTLSTPYSGQPQEPREFRKNPKQTPHNPLCRILICRRHFRPEHIPQTALARIHTLKGRTTPKGSSST